MSNWLTEAVAKENAYDEGYEAGRQAAIKQIFEDLDEFLEVQETRCTNKRLKEIGDWIFHEYLPSQLVQLKKKYEVK